MRSDICPSCCGTKRLIEIDCPEVCGWLAEGRANDVMKEWQEYSKAGEPRKVQRWMTVVRDLQPLVAVIEQAIVDVAAATRDLTDETVAGALETVRKGYATETSGILYAPAALSPLVEVLARPMRSEVEKLRESVRREGAGELPIEAVIACLEVTADRVAFHRSRGEGGGFVSFLRRVRRPSGRSADERGSPTLILP